MRYLITGVLRRGAFLGGNAQRGAALLLILASIVLLSTLLLSFMFSVRMDRKSSKVYADSSSTRLTADSVLNLVMSQVERATQGQDADGNALAWASQPGMIRSFDATGALHEAYKLYSWPEMVTGAFSANDPAGLPPNDWASQPALFTDLNAPLRGRYPIINPGALTKVEGFEISGAPGSASEAPVMPVYWLYKLRDGTWVSPESTGDGNKARVRGASKENPIIARAAFWTDDETSKLNINTASEGQFWDTPRAHTPWELNLGLAQPAKNEYQRYPGHPFSTSLSPVLAGYAPALQNAGILDPEVSSANGYKGSFSNRSPVEDFLKHLYELTPRASWGGSEGGTIPFGYNTAPVTIKSDRLYASVDELAFRAPSASSKERTLLEGAGFDLPLSQQSIEELRFFLTVNSRAPEVNLFNQPRVSIWPVDDPTRINPVRGASNDPARALADQRSPLDKLLAFCSTIGTEANAKPFYFTRSNPASATADLQSGSRNMELYEYLEGFLEKPVPGFGARFSEKYPKDYQQILTEIFDYIRITNLLYAGGPNPDPTYKADFLYAFTTPPSEEGTSSPAYRRHNLPHAGGVEGGPGPAPTRFATYAAGGQVVPISGPNNTKGFGNFPTLSSVAVMFIVSHVSPNDVDGKPNYTWDSTAKKWAEETGVNKGSGVPKCPDIYYKWEDALQTGDYNGGNGDLTSPFDRSLPDGSVRMQAVLLVNPFLVSPGYPGANPDYRIRIRGLDGFSVNGVPMNFPNDGTLVMSGNFLGPSGDALTLSYSNFAASPGLMTTYLGRNLGVPGTPSRYYYPFFAQTPPVVTTAPSTFKFGGATLAIEIQTSGKYNVTGSVEIVQGLEVTFPDADFSIPVLPEDNKVATAHDWGEMNSGFNKTVARNTAYAIRHFGDSKDTGNVTPAVTDIAPGRYGRFRQNKDDGWSEDKWSARFIMPLLMDAANNTPGANMVTTDTADTVQSMEVAHGDTRLIAGLQEVDASAFAEHVDYGAKRSAHSFRRGNYGSYYIGVKPGSLMASGTYNHTSKYSPTGMTDYINYSPMVGSNVGPGHWPSNWSEGGDWDTGVSRLPDGPFINKPDEGTGFGNVAGGEIPYFAKLESISYYSAVGANRVSPNRIMPSPVMFGSLPTGVIADRPWQTLLFNPNPRAGDNHFAKKTSPSDHLILDLFQMPVVEPYAISEPFSTAGKVNMNYRLVPFRHITRSSALRGVLKSVKVTAIPGADIDKYKGGTTPGTAPVASANYRYPIHAGETLKALEDRFDGKFSGKPEIFKSATEICDISLYPADQNTPSTALVEYDETESNIKNWWSDKTLTGDNLREQPYAAIYPRLTTKSNTFTVHMLVQTLTKIKNDTEQDIWNEDRDVVTGEYRGSSTFERYIDPNNPDLPDFATEPGKSIDPYYRFRIVNTMEFKP